ncbi:hypothetical protein [Microbacterium sp.]|uniref:hypothetical protein n=1 Tax=Microbacterium sp. TaxID=51671 RepID=UPI003C763E10
MVRFWPPPPAHGPPTYRYARAQVGRDAELAPYDLPDELAERCVVCFEVNPSHGYPWHETEPNLPSRMRSPAG